MVRIRPPFDLDTFLNRGDKGTTVLSFPKKQILFSQGIRPVRYFISRRVR